jgi:exopolysaccharide biosynthesis predicted pyruvyltransferase EpsI
MSNHEFDFEKVIRFLASGKVVVTNSYHGAYWAILLGCRVCLYHAFSIKFKKMKHQPGFITIDATSDEAVEDAINNAITYPNAYDECLQANIDFEMKVNNL